jgi:hypothetical protein
VGFELAIPTIKLLQTYTLAAGPPGSAYLSLRTFFSVHLTVARLSGTKLLLVYESSSEQSLECFRKHICLAEDVLEHRTECTGLLCMCGELWEGLQVF